MPAFYNEIEPYPAEWLRNLARAGHVAPGDVEERSIALLSAADVKHYTQAHFFAGIGIWSYALRLAGWPDDLPVWTGSCPCQPFSQAGRGKGFDDERHLWPVWFRLIDECRPPIVFGEQVSSTDGLTWFDAVSADLERAGYAVGAVDSCAAGIGAPHLRHRLYFVAVARGLADDDGEGRRLFGQQSAEDGDAPPRLDAHRGDPLDPWERRRLEWLLCTDGKLRPTQFGLFPLAHGNPGRVGRLRAYGNALVAPLAALFVRSVMDSLGIQGIK